jgi:hypothetical protein
MKDIKLTWKYSLAFYFLTMLYSSLHELVHHFAGFLICGEWGYKSFNYFKTACSGDPMILMATYAGPIFTYLVMWIGAYILSSKSSSQSAKQFSFALIFAQMPLQRMVVPFFKMNDEYYATSTLFGKTALVYWVVVFVVWLCCVPPLAVAYKAINNKNKLLLFLFFAFLFPYVLWGPAFVLLEHLLVNKQILNETVIGIAYLFILNEVFTVCGYIFTKKYLYT